MYYFALLLIPDDARPSDPDGRAAMLAAYQEFNARAATAIRAGDALAPSASGVRITGGPTAAVATDGPFAEGAEVAAGYYIFEAENLDEALALARDIPAAAHGAVEIRPMVGWHAPAEPPGADWFALLLEPPANVTTPDTEEWETGMCAHAEFGKAAGDHILGGAPLHPPATATTVRVRDGNVLLTDGPFAEGAEVASGFYLLRCGDRDEATRIASMIPATSVELRQLAGMGVVLQAR